MSAPLWTSDDVRAATGGTGGAPWVARGVSIDSRTTAAGDLFVALEGPRFDGHDYVADAFAAGAAAAMVARKPADVTPRAPLVNVGDTQIGLEMLAAHARNRTGARVVAVTGSAGKTGTKEALRLALAESGPVYASAASYNNKWGVPLSLARMPAPSAYGVFEIGMNHAGEIAPLSLLARPHIAIVTTVEAVHLEFFSSVERIADAKAEVFEGLEPGGTAILNRDNPMFERLATAARARGARIVGFGSDAGADARLEKQALLETCSTVSARICGEPVTYKVGAPGRHWVLNTLVVLAAVAILGADLGRAALAMARVDPGPGRGRRTRVGTADGTFEIIDESYNANPASARAAIEVLGAVDLPRRGRRIAVLGDMLELGPEARRLHEGLAAAVEESGVDVVFTVGDLARTLHDVLPQRYRGGHADDAQGAADEVVRIVKPGDAVLVKGSHPVGMVVVVDALAALAGRGAA